MMLQNDKPEKKNCIAKEFNENNIVVLPINNDYNCGYINISSCCLEVVILHDIVTRMNLELDKVPHDQAIDRQNKDNVYCLMYNHEI